MKLTITSIFDSGYQESIEDSQCYLKYNPEFCRTRNTESIILNINPQDGLSIISDIFEFINNPDYLESNIINISIDNLPNDK